MEGRNIFQIIKEKNLEKLTQYLNKESFDKKELYRKEDRPILPITYAAELSFWKGVALIAARDKYNSVNAEEYKEVIRDAIEQNQIEATESLLKANTPLTYFANGDWHTYLIGNANILTYVIKHFPDNEMVKILLRYLSNESNVLLSYTPMYFNLTPVHAACSANKLDIAQMILEHPGYRLNASDYLIYISSLPNPYQSEIAKKLTQNAMQDKSWKEDLIKTAVMQWELLKNQERTICYLVDQGFNFTQSDENTYTPIELAIANKKVHCAKLLIKIENEKNPTYDPKRIVALHYSGALLLAIKNNEPEIARVLLENHAKLNVNMVEEALRVNNGSISKLLFEYDANPLIKGANGNYPSHSYVPYETRNRLQQIEGFIKPYLPPNEQQSLKPTSAEQYYEYADTLSELLNNGSIKSDDIPKAIEYLGMSFLYLFSGYVKKIEQLKQSLTAQNNKSDMNFQKTITQTNRPDTPSGRITLLKTVLNDLISQLDPKKKSTQHRDQAIYNNLIFLSSINWQNSPDVKIIIDHLWEYLNIVMLDNRSFVFQIKNYLYTLVGRINDNEKKWEYKNLMGKIINKKPGHIESIIPLLAKLKYSISDVEVLKIFITVKNTFDDVRTKKNENRLQSTQDFANKEWDLIEQISYKTSAVQLTQSGFMLTQRYLTNYLPQVGTCAHDSKVYDPLCTYIQMNSTLLNLPSQQQDTQGFYNTNKQVPTMHMPYVYATTQPIPTIATSYGEWQPQSGSTQMLGSSYLIPAQQTFTPYSPTQPYVLARAPMQTPQNRSAQTQDPPPYPPPLYPYPTNGKEVTPLVRLSIMNQQAQNRLTTNTFEEPKPTPRLN